MSCCDNREVVTTEKAKAIGPYSVGVKAGHFVYCSGQVGLDQVTGNLVEGGIEGETRQTLINLSNILQAAGSNLERVVKTTVFLRDMNDFARMNAAYAEFFQHEPPARTTIQAAALPRNAAVVIEAIALLAPDDVDGCCGE
ncbi:MAG: RidA family protein [Anaerolineaceae bacterium]|nr:RidA family protein [Anaerolineaceae bacterium]